MYTMNLISYSRMCNLKCIFRSRVYIPKCIIIFWIVHFRMYVPDLKIHLRMCNLECIITTHF